MLNYKLDIQKQSLWYTNQNYDDMKSVPFLVVEAGEFFANPTFYTNRAGHSFFSMMYTVSGVGKLTYQNREYSLKKGSLVILNPQIPQSYASASSKTWQFTWLNFLSSYGDGFNKQLIEEPFRPIELEADNPVAKDLKQIVVNLEKPLKENDLINSALLDGIYMKLISRKMHREATPVNDSYSDRVLDYIHQHYREDISIDDISQAANLSKFYLIKVFRDITGVTPYEYLISYRLFQAKKLLKSTDDSIDAISERVGYNNSSGFIRAFKKRFNITPDKYRNIRSQ